MAITHGEAALAILLDLQKANKLDANTQNWLKVTEDELADLRKRKQ